ncbi:MAG TPA: transposase, partial [Chloroflexota bacterium]|nr:transposase [Chloroflexota bacterium]
MLGNRGAQGRLFDASWRYGDFVGRDSFYGFLAQQRDVLFADAKFAELYCADNGRPSVPPSVLATALVLQTHDRASDEEARQRAMYDLRWKVALGVEWDRQPFAKSTLQEFRAQLVVHEKQLDIFHESLKLAREQGFIKQQKKLKIALDTSNILGAAAVKDTFNLLGDGIVQVGRELAKQAGMTLEAWAEGAACSPYVSGSSLKGQADIAWDRPAERKRFLRQIVADADRLLELARVARDSLKTDSPEDQALTKAAGLLSRILLQNIERTPRAQRTGQAATPGPAASTDAGGATRPSSPATDPASGAQEPTTTPEPVPAHEPTAAAHAAPNCAADAAAAGPPPPPEASVEDIDIDIDIKQGVAPDRLLSVHDPDMRHGHKSAAKRFNGHKAQVAVDTDSQLITAVAVLPGNAPDHDQALAMVTQTETNTDCSVSDTVGDCAYGDGPTRQAFADAGRTLVAKVPTATNQGRFPKTDF